MYKFYQLSSKICLLIWMVLISSIKNYKHKMHIDLNYSISVSWSFQLLLSVRETSWFKRKHKIAFFCQCQKAFPKNEDMLYVLRIRRYNHTWHSFSNSAVELIHHQHFVPKTEQVWKSNSTFNKSVLYPSRKT